MSNFSTVGHEEPRVRRRRANRGRILRAALEIVVDEGFDRLTLQRVAAATDYTRAALYRYFASKEALISALAVTVIDDIRAQVGDRVAIAAGAPPLVRVHLAIDEFQRFVGDNPAQFGMISMLMAESRVVLPDEESSALAVAALERALAPLAALIAEAQSIGQLAPGDAQARATVLFASIHGALQLRKQTRLSAVVASTDTLCSMALSALLAGWGADQSALDDARARARKSGDTP